MDVVYFGSDEFGLPTLEALIGSPSHRQGEQGSTATASPVQEGG